jgi:sulfhydrogenase subunit beta (sulfur reductase)
MTKVKQEGDEMKSTLNLPSGEVGSGFWMISRQQLENWLDGIAAVRTLLAPVEDSGVILYRQVANSAGIAPIFTRPLMSIKGVFFPPTERMFTIHKTGEEIRLEENLPEGETVVFGVRPCDARGTKLLDALFLDTNPVDPFYERRRDNTTLIGLACKELGPNCFCTSVGGTPDDASGMDIMLYEVEEGYLVQAVTEKGRFLIPGGEWKETEVRHQPMTLEGEYPVPAHEKWPQHFTDAFWARIGERCLSCRACAYVCPTCRCFVVRDEMVAPGEFERIRCWDSCMGENYRRVAGGHKPRTKRGERQRNRFFCKFYYYPEQYGLGTASACTGCGRCIEVCPVGVDVTEVLVELEATQ